MKPPLARESDPWFVGLVPCLGLPAPQSKPLDASMSRHSRRFYSVPTAHLLCIALHCVFSRCIPPNLIVFLWRTNSLGLKRWAQSLLSAANFLCGSECTEWRQHIIRASLSQTRAFDATPMKQLKPRTSCRGHVTASPARRKRQAAEFVSWRPSRFSPSICTIPRRRARTDSWWVD